MYFIYEFVITVLVKLYKLFMTFIVYNNVVIIFNVVCKYIVSKHAFILPTGYQNSGKS